MVDFGFQNVKWYHLVHLCTKIVILCYSLHHAIPIPMEPSKKIKGWSLFLLRYPSRQQAFSLSLTLSTRIFIFYPYEPKQEVEYYSLRSEITVLLSARQLFPIGGSSFFSIWCPPLCIKQHHRSPWFAFAPIVDGQSVSKHVLDGSYIAFPPWQKNLKYLFLKQDKRLPLSFLRACLVAWVNSESPISSHIFLPFVVW
jgi:hypothetical protein